MFILVYAKPILRVSRLVLLQCIPSHEPMDMPVVLERPTVGADLHIFKAPCDEALSTLVVVCKLDVPAEMDTHVVNECGKALSVGISHVIRFDHAICRTTAQQYVGAWFWVKRCHGAIRGRLPTR